MKVKRTKEYVQPQKKDYFGGKLVDPPIHFLSEFKRYDYSPFHSEKYFVPCRDLNPGPSMELSLKEMVYQWAIVLPHYKKQQYSRDPNSEHSNTGILRKPDILKVGSNHLKTGLKCPVFNQYRQPRPFIYKIFFFFIYKTVQASEPSKTGLKCPVFEWSTSLDQFIYKEKNILYIKQSRLVNHLKSRTWSTIQNPDNSGSRIPTVFANIYCEKLLFYRFAGFVWNKSWLIWTSKSRKLSTFKSLTWSCAFTT